MKFRKVTYCWRKQFPRLQMRSDCLVKALRERIEGTRKWRMSEKGLLTAPTRHAGLATIPCSLLRIGSVPRLGSPCLCDRDQTTGETNCRNVEVTSTGPPGPKRELPLRGRDTTAQRYDVAVSEVDKMFASQRPSWARRARQTRSHRMGSCLHPVPSNLFCVREPRGSLDKRRYMLLARSCAADLEDYQSVFRTLCACALKLVPRDPG